MGERTAIGWTDHTFNGWWGCTPVGPGCDECYAEDWDERWGGGHWGDQAPRRRTSARNWAAPYKWNREAPAFFAVHGHWPRVFTLSMGDFLDNRVPQPWRDDKLAVIEDTPKLRWQILTKRLSNARKMIPADFFRRNRHVELMATIVNQDEADRDVPRLLALKAALGIRWVGVSCEPLLGPLNLTTIKASHVPGTLDDSHIGWTFNALTSGDHYSFVDDRGYTQSGDGPFREHALDWVIVGGESGAVDKVRVHDLAWDRQIIADCRAAGVAVFEKQLGRRPVVDGRPIQVKHPKGEDWSEWPAELADLRVREFPEALQ